MTDIVIRRAETPDEYRALQDAQRRTWGIVDDSYLLPVSTMISVQMHGGVVLGAFRPDGSAAGLSFGFLARIEGRIGLYSQITGVVPEAQGTGLGTRMKLAQRDLCRAEGLPVIAWAFDLYRGGNARFNLQKLGATAGRFVADMYGPRTDALNSGAPTDRLVVEWDIHASPRPDPDEADLASLPRLIVPPPSTWSVAEIERLAREPIAGPAPRMSISRKPEAPRELLEIPTSFETLRRDDPESAARWRSVVGKLFAGAFEMGYRAVGFVRDAATSRCFYILEAGHEPMPMARPGATLK